MTSRRTLHAKLATVLQSGRCVSSSDVSESPSRTFFFFLNDRPPPEFSPLPLPDALPICRALAGRSRRRDLAAVAALTVAAVAVVTLFSGVLDARPGDRAHARIGEPVRAALDTGPASCQRSEEHTSELQSPCNLVCRLLLE